MMLSVQTAKKLSILSKKRGAFCLRMPMQFSKPWKTATVYMRLNFSVFTKICSPTATAHHHFTWLPSYGGCYSKTNDKLDNSPQAGGAHHPTISLSNELLAILRAVTCIRTLIYSWFLPPSTSTNFFQKKCKKWLKTGSEKGSRPMPVSTANPSFCMLFFGPRISWQVFLVKVPVGTSMRTTSISSS